MPLFRRYRKLFILFFVLFFWASSLTAQKTEVLSFKIESGLVMGEGKYNPLWLTADKSGLGSISTSTGYIDAGLFYQQQFNKNWKLEGQLEIARTYNFAYSFLVRQAYADINYKWLWLSVGIKTHKSQIVNS